MKPATRLAVLGGVAATIYQLEAYGVLVALPSMASDLKLGPSGAAWIPAAYLVAATGGLVGAGALAGRWSYRNLFAIALALLGLGALACAVAPAGWVLLAGRAVQGLGGGVLAATGYSLVGVFAPEGERRAILGWLTVGAGAGMMLGAPLGGWLAGAFSWRVLFGLLAVLMMLAQVLFAFAPKVAGSGGRGDAGWLGAVALGLGAASLGAGATLADGDGISGGASMTAFVFGAVALGFFGWQERHGRKPMFPRTVWSNGRLWQRWLGLFATILALAGTTFLLPFHLEQDFALSPGAVGSVLLALTGAYAGGALAQSILTAWLAPGWQAVSGLGLAGVGAGCFAVGGVETVFAATLACGAIGLGVGVALPVINDQVVADLAPADRPRGSTLIPLGINLGSVAGVVVCGVAVQTIDHGAFASGGFSFTYEPAFWIPVATLAVGLVSTARVAAR